MSRIGRSCAELAVAPSIPRGKAILGTVSYCSFFMALQLRTPQPLTASPRPALAGTALLVSQTLVQSAQEEVYNTLLGG